MSARWGCNGSCSTSRWHERPVTNGTVVWFLAGWIVGSALVRVFL